MKGILVLAALAFCGNALAKEVIVCKQTGYTNNPDKFNAIKVDSKDTVFTIDGKTVSVGVESFVSAKADKFDLEGLAITYYQPKRSALLYVYRNESKQLEVGISLIAKDSDALFMDKTLFTGCTRYKDLVESIEVDSQDPGMVLTPTVFRF